MQSHNKLIEQLWLPPILINNSNKNISGGYLSNHRLLNKRLKTHHKQLLIHKKKQILDLLINSLKHIILAANNTKILNNNLK